MFKTIVCRGISVIRRMNQWWDKDEEKEIASVVAGLIILLGIIILNKGLLFFIALFFIANRVLHRCNVWTLLEGDLCEADEAVSSPLSSRPDPAPGVVPSGIILEAEADKDIGDFEIKEVKEK